MYIMIKGWKGNKKIPYKLVINSKDIRLSVVGKPYGSDLVEYKAWVGIVECFIDREEFERLVKILDKLNQEEAIKLNDVLAEKNEAGTKGTKLTESMSFWKDKEVNALLGIELEK